MSTNDHGALVLSEWYVKRSDLYVSDAVRAALKKAALQWQQKRPTGTGGKPMTKDELLKLFNEAPDLTWIPVPYAQLDREARELLQLNDPIQEFQQRINDQAIDRHMLKDGVDYLSRQLTIVLLKRGVNPARLKKAPFSAQIREAKNLNPPLDPPTLIQHLEELNELYTMTHDPTLISFSQHEWAQRIEKMLPDVEGLRMRVYLTMFLCAINLDKLGGNTRPSNPPPQQ